MKIGMFTANFMDHDLEEVFKMMAEMGYETAELPAFSDNGHLDIDRRLAGIHGGDPRIIDKEVDAISGLALAGEVFQIDDPTVKTIG